MIALSASVYTLFLLNSCKRRLWCRSWAVQTPDASWHNTSLAGSNSSAHFNFPPALFSFPSSPINLSCALVSVSPACNHQTRAHFYLPPLLLRFRVFRFFFQSLALLFRMFPFYFRLLQIVFRTLGLLFNQTWKMFCDGHKMLKNWYKRLRRICKRFLAK